MHRQYQLKYPRYYDLVPLLDRGFDERQPNSITDYSIFLDHRFDESSYIMRFDENAKKTKQ